ncbi:MAG: hypothetical protein J2P21_15860 [Chloracidobacterium sp.]|nr:hypothetical protein [Chloracidobacterium sp.]
MFIYSRPPRSRGGAPIQFATYRKRVVALLFEEVRRYYKRRLALAKQVSRANKTTPPFLQRARVRSAPSGAAEDAAASAHD